VSSLRRGNANLLCILSVDHVPLPREEQDREQNSIYIQHIDHVMSCCLFDCHKAVVGIPKGYTQSAVEAERAVMAGCARGCLRMAEGSLGESRRRRGTGYY